MDSRWRNARSTYNRFEVAHLLGPDCLQFFEELADSALVWLSASLICSAPYSERSLAPRAFGYSRNGVRATLIHGSVRQRPWENDLPFT